MIRCQSDVDTSAFVPLDAEAEGRVDVDELAHLADGEGRAGVGFDRLAADQLQGVEGRSAGLAHSDLDGSRARDPARSARYVLGGDLERGVAAVLGADQHVVAAALELVVTSVERRVVGVAHGAAHRWTGVLLAHPLPAAACAVDM